MTTLTQSRVSPAATTSTVATTKQEPSSPPSSTTDLYSWAANSSSKKSSRFRRRRRRQSSSTAQTYMRSQSSMSLDSSTHSAAEGGKQRKRSLLYRLLGKSKKSLVIETTQPLFSEHKETSPQDTAGTLEQRNDCTSTHEEDTSEIDLLEAEGQQLRLGNQMEEAMATWKRALTLSRALCHNATCKSNQIRCRMIDLHLHQLETDHDNTHLEQAHSIIADLEPLRPNDTSPNQLQASPLLMDLLTSHSLWGFALRVSHQMPETEPLTLARLHLEVALAPEAQSDGRAPLTHLSDCHQLLLTVHPEDDDEETEEADTLWQELAQAYGSLGEDELALGCSQSRLQHLAASPQQVALAHYDQALNVYSPVGQYGLALKEAELALTALADNHPAADDDDDDDDELLHIKLVQFKADVLCRLGCIAESIQSYEQLLQALQKSNNHGPVDQANVLYILGKLSVRNKRFRSALEYFDQELVMTKSVVGSCHLAISKILHELARTADLGLMDYPLAVQYYEEALRVESGVYHQAKAQPALRQDAKSQMGETKQRLGKLHFKMGDFATAVKTTLAVDK